MEATHDLLKRNERQFAESIAKIELSDLGFKWLEEEHSFHSMNDKYNDDKITIDDATVFLYVHFKNIRSVEEWALSMGYSKEYFWRKCNAAFDVTPRKIFIEMNKRVLINYLKKKPCCKSTEAAKKIHLADGNSLLQFVKLHFGCTPTKLRKKVLNIKDLK